MNEHYVTSLEWSERLKEVGIPQISEFYWVHTKGFTPEWVIMSKKEASEKSVESKGYSWFDVCEDIDIFSAYLTDELAVMLPKSLDIKRAHYWLQIEVQEMQEGWSCQYKNAYRCYKFFENRTMPNALAAMVEYCKQKGLI